MVEKKDVWSIVSTQQVIENVYFNEPLTAEEAKEAYLYDNYADILDGETEYVEKVIEVF